MLAHLCERVGVLDQDGDPEVNLLAEAFRDLDANSGDWTDYERRVPPPSGFEVGVEYEEWVRNGRPPRRERVRSHR